MPEMGERGERPVLKQLVIEASLALARLDSARLEQLAVPCRALCREVLEASEEEYEQFAEEARQAVSEMAVFALVLEGTRSNMTVIQKAWELCEGRVEYNEAQVRGARVQRWADAESRHGDD